MKPKQTERPSATADKIAHTPGPWKVEVWPGSCVTVQGGGDFDFCVAKCGKDDSRVANANARLIAAAPELLEELKKAYVDLGLLHIGDSGEWKNSCKAERIRAAISKAEGK